MGLYLKMHLKSLAAAYFLPLSTLRKHHIHTGFWSELETHFLSCPYQLLSPPTLACAPPIPHESRQCWRSKGILPGNVLAS